ncbi:hypothetical protein UFOVP965_84 [uncultured Caudovirales phage]|uniref:Uncharacterized protein n=1 Tax=uncultured Caudovirales phage TaxID=2100421 RepID=A0A6J5Q6C1_9CAUD|nr:hypothetical protein UFOVP965_84 [uncultured Caudovirales phage]CAB4179849.1 hypothetical protein UFOVP1035_80 [uncultured Caudovirales phage]CAB4188602.1 hypothetical protein UFOVP1181_39 [uncultured Caudovirales phage]
MFIEMSCNCSASFQADIPETDTLLLVWAQSFVNAHNECGFMTKPIAVDVEEKLKRYDIIYKEKREKEL